MLLYGDGGSVFESMLLERRVGERLGSAVNL